VFSNDRLMMSVKVPDLAGILRKIPLSDPGIEHVFDY
jgi:hypothetical protein